MDEIISKTIADRLMKLKGEVRGLAIKSHGAFILKEKGEDGLKRLEDFMRELGYPLIHENIKGLSFCPVGLEVMELLVIKQLFDFNDEKFVEIGAFSSKLSLIMRMFIKYFVSVKLMAHQSPKIWEEYYTIGKLSVPEFNEEKKRLVLRVKDLNLHPLHCLHLKGYFSSVVKMVTNREVSCEETKCIYNGDDSHDFSLQW